MLNEDKKLNIAYYLQTDIQHFPPIYRLLPLLGGIIITANEEIYNYIKTKYPDLENPVYLVKHRSGARRIIVRKKIRMIIYSGFNSFYFGKSVQIFHGGLSDKNYVESLNIVLYNLVLFPGEKTKDKVEKAGYLKYIKDWKIIGYPKFDPLILNKLNVTPVFNNGKKTILYAPTWIAKQKITKIIKFSEHGETSLNIWAKKIIQELHKDFNIIIKYHSKIDRSKNDIYEQIETLIKDLNAQENVITKIDDNILPYMYQADLMISDISTACYEWFHFDKPLIYANPAPGKYFPSNDISSNTYAWQAGDVINNENEILPLVKENLSVDKYKKIRSRIFNYTVSQPDGNATERQANAIRDFYINLPKTPYLLFMIQSYLWSRGRRIATKFINRYYYAFNKKKIGK